MIDPFLVGATLVVAREHRAGSPRATLVGSPLQRKKEILAACGKLSQGRF